ncbi:hypothetical protein [Ascidiaceihabitans sp.]|uniref:hypothetical protein n=2 Tax=Paracoccaceae TaxID=31989 RepID=UPI00329680C5
MAMNDFESVEDVSAWLAPLGYDAFWQAVAPHQLFGADEQRHCDQTIAQGIAPFETVLTVLKSIARIELTARHGLKHRSTMRPEPQLALVD